MKPTKPETKLQKIKESKVIQLMKVHFPNGVVVEVSAPYCTREEWAERTGMDKEVVQLALYNRQIARHKFSPKGDLYVNVIEEMRRLFDVQPWNR